MKSFSISYHKPAWNPRVNQIFITKKDPEMWSLLWILSLLVNMQLFFLCHAEYYEILSTH